MKKLLFGLLSIAMCFALTGCGNNASDDNKKAIEQGESGDDNENSDIKLYSSDNRLVFNANDMYFIVVDFDADGNATALKWIYNYQDSLTAKTMVSAIKANLDEEDDVKSVEQDGKYIVVEYEEPAYEGLNYETTKAAFSMYKEVDE
jgi:hypothetical protein